MQPKEMTVKLKSCEKRQEQDGTKHTAMDNSQPEEDDAKRHEEQFL